MNKRDNRLNIKLIMVCLLSFFAVLAIIGGGTSLKLRKQYIEIETIEEMNKETNKETNIGDDYNTETVVAEKNEGVSADAPLYALVDSEEQAKVIADQYEITLVAYSYGVATYTTDKDLDEVVKYGKQMGYDEVHVNHEKTMY